MSSFILCISSCVVSMLNILLYECNVVENSFCVLLFWINFTILLTMILTTLYKNPKVVLTLFFSVFAHLLALISCFLGEYYGEYLDEIGVFAYFKGASLWLILYCSLFLGTAILTFDFFCRKNSSECIDLDKKIRINSKYDSLFFIITLLCILAMGMCFSIYGVPLNTHTVRFDYWSSIPWIYKKIYILITALPLYFGMSYTNRKRNNILFFICVTISVLSSDKFSGISNMFFLYSLGFFLSKQDDIIISKNIIFKYLIILSLASVMIFNLIMYHYNNFGGGFSGYTGLQAIYYRLLGEGQVEFYFLNQQTTHLYDFLYEISNWFSLSPDFKNIGMYKLMGILGHDVQLVSDRGIRLTMAFPAIIVYYVGEFISIPIVSLFGYILGRLHYALYRNIHNYNILKSFILYRLIMLCIEAFCMGNLHRLFSIEALFLILLYYSVSRTKIILNTSSSTL